MTAGVIGGVAIAQTSAPTHITACVADTTGNVRIVGSTSDCKPNEASMTWSQQGPAGRDGTDGMDGAQGPPGPSGTARAWGQWGAVQNALIFQSGPEVSVEHSAPGRYCVRVADYNVGMSGVIVATLSVNALHQGLSIGYNRGTTACPAPGIEVAIRGATQGYTDEGFSFIIP